VPVDTMVHRPMLIDVVDCFAAFGSVDGSFGRVRSPRRCTSAMITVLPPRVMLGVPEMLALRDTLLPLSCRKSMVCFMLVGNRKRLWARMMGMRMRMGMIGSL
jgi:hypothetical protein